MTTNWSWRFRICGSTTPRLRSAKLTFRQCLSHQTHLPAVEPLYTYGLEPATLRAFILQRAWRHGPPVYSDINFMLLGIAIERMSGCSARRVAATARTGVATDAGRDRGD